MIWTSTFNAFWKHWTKTGAIKYACFNLKGKRTTESWEVTWTETTAGSLHWHAVLDVILGEKKFLFFLNKNC